jgi:hypothetical protein
MTWFEVEREFKKALNKKRNKDALVVCGFLSPIKNKKNNTVIKSETVIKGEKFLSSLCKLKSLMENSNEVMWEKFLQSATTTINQPTQKNYSKLNTHLRHLETEISISSTFCGIVVNGFDIFTHFIGLALSITGVFMGSILFECAIGGACLLAIGPWGGAALGVGLAALGVIVAIISAYKLYKDLSHCGDNPLKKIVDFVDHLNPMLSTYEVEPSVASPEDNLESATGLMFST